MPIRTWSVLALTAFFSSGAIAAPLPKDPAKGMPHLVVQIKPIEGLIEDYKVVQAQLKDAVAGGLPSTDEIEGAASTEFPDWRKGIDLKKPLGICLTVQPELKRSRPVILVPIADKKVALEIFAKLFSNVKEDEKGYYSGTFEFIFSKYDVYFRFQNGYVYITAENPAAVEDAKGLPDPADVLLKEETAVIALRLYVEGVPDQVKQQARDYLEELTKIGRVGVQEMLLMGMIGARDVADFSARVRRLVDEGKWVALRLDFDRKTQELALEFNLSPVKGSSLGKEIAGFQPAKSRLAGLLDEQTAVGVTHSFGNFGSLKIDPNSFETALKEFLRDNELDGSDTDMAKLAKAVLEAVKVNEADLGVALKRAPDAKRYTLVAGARLNQAPRLGLVLTGYMLSLPKEKRERFTPSVMKLEGVPVHKLTLASIGAETKELIGDNALYFFLKDDMFFAAIGPGATDRLKECLKLAPKDGPQFRIEANPTLLRPLLGALTDKQRRVKWQSLFPKDVKFRILDAKVEGGSMLRVRYVSDIVPVVKLLQFISELR